MADETLLDLLLRQAECHQDKVAFRFCPDGIAEETRITYRELDTRARAIAADLQQHGAAGRRVLLFCQPGLDSIAGFFGCFYAGAVAVPVDMHWPSERGAAVIPDARADFALAPAKMLAKLTARTTELLGEQSLRWCTLDPAVDEIDEHARHWMMPRVDADTTAVLQYTSGTTGSPKGVVLTHRNYLHNLTAGRQAWNPGLDDPVYDSPVTGVSWLPHFHDMGFVGGVLGLIYSGGSGVLMSPGAFVRRPMRWLEAMSHHRAVVGAAPNLGYRLCVKRSTPEERAALDLSHWAVAVNGGDPVSASALQDFAEAFAPAGFRPEAFRPAYGLAEATLGVAGIAAAAAPVIVHIDRAALGANRVVDAAPEDAGATTVVGCGRPAGGYDVVIVDPDTRLRCAAGEVGEIWVAGASVAQGYWRRPDETQRTFAALLADTGEGPFLRTGDRGFLRSGELFITGRCQDLITIDGTHYYPTDIETTVQDCDPALLPGRGAAFAVKPRSDAAERLIVVQELHRHRAGEAELAGLIDTIRAAITQHHRIEAHTVALVKPMRIPTTSSGKIRRDACRRQFLHRKLEPVAQWQAADAVGGSGAPQLKTALARAIGGALARRYWGPARSDLP